MTQYVDRRLDAFIAEHAGKTVDRTGVYGIQAPDLVDEWIECLTGFEMKSIHHAADYWKRGLPHFDRIVYGDGYSIRRGDILVWSGEPGSYGTRFYGTAGIALDAQPDVLTVFDQGPHPAKKSVARLDGLVGGLRLSRQVDRIMDRADFVEGRWHAPAPVPAGRVITTTTPDARPPHWLKRLFLSR